MTRAVVNIDSKSVNSSLTRRAALSGLAVLAAPSTALAVCVVPDPDVELIEIGKRFMCLDRAAREAWKVWEPHNQQMVDVMVNYERSLPQGLPHEKRCDLMDQHLETYPETPEYSRSYKIANGLSDQRDAAMYEAFRHKPATITGFAVYAIIIKTWNFPLWKKEPDDLDLDETTIRLLVDHLIDHADVLNVLSVA